MEWLDANVGSLQLALEQAPEVFHTVGVNLSINVLFGVVDNLVLESLLLESHVGHERIGIDRAASFDVSANIGLQKMFLAIADDSSANLTTAFKNALNSSLVFGTSIGNPALAFVSVHVSGKAANESFVNFNLGPGTAKLHKRANLHREPDAVEHEPSGLLSDAKSAANLIGTDTVFTIRNHPNSDKPLVQANWRILKDSPYLDGKLAVMVDSLALPFVLILKKHHVLAPASG